MVTKISTFILIAFLSLAGFAQTQLNEKETMTKARKLFDQKKYAEAISLYDSVGAKSDRWLLAVEEKAWAQMHLDQFDKALANARTLTSPALNAITGTEPYLLKAILQLKICDYVSLFQTLKDFKAQKRAQVEAIQEIVQKGRNAISFQTLQKWSAKPEDWKALGSNIALMPQLFYLDNKMIQAAKSKNFVTMEARLKELAVIDNNENFRILQKLNLVEVEGVQRVHIATEFNGRQGETVEKGKYDLVFKDSKDQRELWLDEITGFQADIKRCGKKSGRTM